MEFSRSEGYKKVWLFTEAVNKDAVSLYEETGVTGPTGVHVLYSWELR